MSSEKKVPVWIDRGSHRLLRSYCEKIGKTGIEVLSELIQQNLGKNTETAPAPAQQALGGVWLL